MKTKLDEYIEKFECKTMEGGLHNYQDNNQAVSLEARICLGKLCNIT